MELKILNTKDLTDDLILNYCTSFNKAFNKKLSVDIFLKKYLNGPLKYSFHSLIIEKKKIVAACTIIPQDYNYFGKNVLIGLVVDTFILKEYRKKDPFLLFKMYKSLKIEIKKNNLIATLSIPNINAYNYWKKIVRCKDLMNLNYYTMINNQVIFSLLKFINKLIFRNNSETSKKIKIIKNKNFYSGRLIFNHKIYESSDYRCIFTLHEEKNKKIAYLIDFYDIRTLKKDLNSLIFSLDNIKKSDADIIIFVGKIEIKQCMLFKIPKLFEPKKLNVIIDRFEKDEEILIANNWDFGLLNYDVR